MKTMCTLIVAVAMLLSCSQAPDQASLKVEIEKANSEFMKAVSQKDADALVQLYTEDARLMFPHMPAVTGREEIKGFLQESLNAGMTELKLFTEEVNGTNEFALEHGRYEVFAGENKIDEGKYLVGWKKVDGKWLLHRDMPSTDLPVMIDSAQH